MAAGDIKMVMLQGQGPTAAEAVVAYNTAVQTLLTNAGGAVWQPIASGGRAPICQNSGMIAVLLTNTFTYTCWGQYSYLSAS